MVLDVGWFSCLDVGFPAWIVAPSRGGIQAGKQATKQGSVCIYWKFPLSAQALAQAGFEAAMGALFGPVWQLALLLMVHVAAPDMKSRCLGNGTMSV